MIVADNAHVTYRVFASGKRFSARDNLFRLSALRGGRDLQTVPALRGVSFAAAEGETIGVVGHNGSGKSTLFRAMSGLIPTSEGTIWARDRPVLLGVNAALVPELSGENNIKLGLLAMGFTAEEAAAHVDEIADFAELNEFIHHPMRTYSSGMGARLRFAIASAKAHSILLIDEALSVGDRRFKQKSESRIRELRESAGLVMIVSHSVNSLKDTCDRVLWIHKGELRADGPARDVIDEYIRWTKQPGNAAVGAASSKSTKPGVKATKSAAGVATAQTTEPSTKRAEVSPETASPAIPEVDIATVVLAAAVGDPQQQPVADAARALDDTAPTTVPFPRESSRDIARRERHNRTARQQKRRRIAAVVSTAAAILIAVAAGATIAIIANQPDPGQEPVAISTPTPRPSDSASPPLVRTFGANVGTAVCETADGVAEVQLNWEVEDAAVIALAAGAPGAGVVENLGSGMPASAVAQVVMFPCANESWEYTLSAENVGGARVSSVVTVARELMPEVETPTAPQTRAPQAPAAPVNPVPVVPAPVDPVPVDPVPVDPVPVDPVPVDPVPVDPGPTTEPVPSTDPTTGAEVAG